MKSLSSGGITRRTAWGRTTKRSALPAREPERPGRRLLARVDRVDARPVHLRDVRRVHQRERDDRPQELVVGHAREAQRGDPEPEQEDDQQPRDRPEHVDVDGRQQAQREEHRPRHAAHDGQHQPEHQDQRLGREEQPDVDPELLDQLGQRLPEDRPVEERLLEPRPAGGVDDDVADEPEDDDGRQRARSPATARPRRPARTGAPVGGEAGPPLPPPGPRPGPRVRG